LIHAETGLLELSARLRRRAPEQEVHVHADLNTGFFALSAILAALYNAASAVKDSTSMSPWPRSPRTPTIGPQSIVSVAVMIVSSTSGITPLCSWVMAATPHLSATARACSNGSSTQWVVTRPHRRDARLVDYDAAKRIAHLSTRSYNSHASTVADFADLEARFEPRG
jgi:hypothetical protein